MPLPPPGRPRTGGCAANSGIGNGTISNGFGVNVASGRKRFIHFPTVRVRNPCRRQYSATVSPPFQYSANARCQRPHTTPRFTIVTPPVDYRGEFTAAQVGVTDGARWTLTSMVMFFSGDMAKSDILER
jgi:hypothetical protein